MSTIHLPDEAATAALGAPLAELLIPGTRVFLRGELGAGKTSLVRAYLRALGYTGAVRSPTYTLVESYTLADRTMHHFDLYRLADPQELEFIGIRDYLGVDAIALIEWPERAGDLLLPADLTLELEYARPGRILHCHGRDDFVQALARTIHP